MAIILPLMFFVLSCMDWGSWWNNVTPKGKGELLVIGMFAAAFVIAGVSGYGGRK